MCVCVCVCVLFQVVALSDMFTEKQQYEWLMDTMLEVYRAHPADDELLQQYLVVGMCKAGAVVGMVSGGGGALCGGRVSVGRQGTVEVGDRGVHSSSRERLLLDLPKQKH